MRSLAPGGIGKTTRLSACMLFFGVAYFACAAAGYYFSPSNGPFIHFWLPCGLSVGVLLRYQTRYWPGFLAMALLGGGTFDLVLGHSVLETAQYVGSDCLGALSGAWLMRRFVSYKPDLSTIREVLGMVGFCAILGPSVNASVGLLRFTPTLGFGTIHDSWLFWWSGDMLGVLLVVPLILTWGRDSSSSAGSGARFEAGALFVVVATIATLAFCYTPRLNLHLEYLLIPCVLWATLRFGLRTAAVVNLGTAAFAAWFSSRGYGTLEASGLSPMGQVASLQLFLGVVTLTGLFTAAVLAERNRALGTVRASEARLRRAELAGGFGHWELNLDRGVIKGSEGAWTIYGLGQSEWPAGVVKSFPLPAYRDELDRQLQRVIAGTGTYDIEFEVRRPSDGRIVAVHSTASYDKQSNSVFGVVQDISARRKLEEDLKESESRFRSVVEHAPTAIFVQCEHVIVYANPAALRFFGAESEGHLLGTPVLERARADSRAKVEAYLIQLQEVQRPLPLSEQVFLQLDGSEVEGEVSASAFVFDGRAATVFFVRDTRERKRAETALRETEQRLATVYREAPVWIALTDMLSAEFVEVNDELVQAFGFSREEMIGRTAAGVGWTREEDRSRLVREVRDHGRARGQEMIFRRKDGAELIGLLNGEEVMVGGRRCLLTVTVDITERKRAEAALKDSEEQFRQAQKMEAIGQLAGGVAHDFNNILAAVLMHLGLIQEEASLDPNTRASLKELEREVLRGSSLTRQLLAFSRQQAMAPSAIDLRELMQGLLKMLRRLLGERIELSFQAEPGLPILEADGGMLEQVVMNLCVNGRDAMPRGGQLTLKLEAVDLGWEAAAANPDARTGRFLRLSVSDTGSGMDEATLRHIFEPFFTTKGPGKGTGLGLATVHGIVKQHHGWIEVTSAVGRGSTFRVYLPASGTTAAVGGSGVDPRPLPGRNESVLVVEDEESVRTATLTALRRYGYQTFAAVDATDALRQWDKLRGEVDLLFTDMVMPGEMNGHELATRLRALKPGLRVIISSGYSQEAAHRGLRASATLALLHKPFDMAKLLTTVRQTLDAPLEPLPTQRT